jgi:hypothetical protein
MPIFWHGNTSVNLVNEDVNIYDRPIDAECGSSSEPYGATAHIFLRNAYGQFVEVGYTNLGNPGSLRFFWEARECSTCSPTRRLDPIDRQTGTRIRCMTRGNYDRWSINRQLTGTDAGRWTFWVDCLNGQGWRMADPVYPSNSTYGMAGTESFKRGQDTTLWSYHTALWYRSSISGAWLQWTILDCEQDFSSRENGKALGSSGAYSWWVVWHPDGKDC